jgi:AraC-like DNA-binding protein
MTDTIDSLASQVRLAPDLLKVKTVVSCSNSVPPPRYSYQVRFPRLEFVLSGTYRNALCTPAGEILERDLGTGECLFVPVDSWNKVLWVDDVQGFSLLFGTRQLGLSNFVWERNSASLSHVATRCCSLPADSPLYSIVQALGLHLRQNPGDTASSCLLAQTVVEYALKLLSDPLVMEHSRAKHLYQSVCLYVQENFARTINRDTVAAHFNVSPNYLSKLFRQYGQSGFSDYVVSTRLDRARFMLRHVSSHLDEIAGSCGFRDPNYFCRVFKSRYGRTPTEYRQS